MALILWFIVGLLVGGLASLMVRARGREARRRHASLGVLGAALGGVGLGPVFRAEPFWAGGLTLDALVASAGGAVLLLALLGVLRFGGGRGG
ncbi:MAG: hypothetical protein MUF07_11125 [Steroidobacteraceae bacterium]|nr:hypothetical protein [Steroidobacteraceae bacterium]